VADCAGAAAAYTYAANFAQRASHSVALANDPGAVIHAAEAEAASSFYGLGLPGGPSLPAKAAAAVEARGLVAGVDAVITGGGESPAIQGVTATESPSGGGGGGGVTASSSPGKAATRKGAGVGGAVAVVEVATAAAAEDEKDSFDMEHPPVFKRAALALRKLADWVTGFDDEEHSSDSFEAAAAAADAYPNASQQQDSRAFVNPAFHAFDNAEASHLSGYEQDSLNVWTPLGAPTSVSPVQRGSRRLSQLPTIHEEDVKEEGSWTFPNGVPVFVPK